MNLSKILLLLLLILITFGLIAPNGLRAAIANNLWSIKFVRANEDQTSPTSEVSPPPSTHQHAGLLLAVQALKADEPDQAATYLHNLSPTPDRLTRKTIADVRFLQGDVAEAVSIWKNLGLWFSLEQASRVLEGDDLILAFEAATDLFPERYTRSLINAKLAIANQLRSEGELEKAIILYQELNDQFPEQSQAYYGLAQAYQQAGQVEQALQAIKAGWHLNAENKHFFILAGQLYEQQGRITEAIEAYQEVLNIDPQHQEALDAIQRLSPTP